VSDDALAMSPCIRILRALVLVLVLVPAPTLAMDTSGNADTVARDRHTESTPELSPCPDQIQYAAASLLLLLSLLPTSSLFFFEASAHTSGAGNRNTLFAVSIKSRRGKSVKIPLSPPSTSLAVIFFVSF
jgi:hypothetical protein